MVLISICRKSRRQIFSRPILKSVRFMARERERDNQQAHDVKTASLQRRCDADVASTLIRRCFKLVCLLGGMTKLLFIYRAT